MLRLLILLKLGRNFLGITGKFNVAAGTLQLQFAINATSSLDSNQWYKLLVLSLLATYTAKAGTYLLRTLSRLLIQLLSLDLHGTLTSKETIG